MPFFLRRLFVSGAESPHPDVLSVFGLTQQLKWTLQEQFQDVWVSGEISNLTRARSGHLYLTLSDEQAQLRCVIWRSEAEQIPFDLDEGMQVVCHGGIDVYPPRGTYQLTIREIEPLGLGALQLALKKLHARLEAEGLFAESRKRPLPAFPRRIAVVTSPAGAAIHDFLNVVTRRWPGLEILVIPARVQGEGAAREISEGVVVAGLIQPPPDVVVVTRGGGSAEDLWSFNDEQVVRAIAACRIPVISGVGHEIDVTLCDLVADVRALTPSEAAERVVPIREEVNERLDKLRQRISMAMVNRLERARERLGALQQRRVLQAPADLVSPPARRVDELEQRLHELMQRSRQRHEHRLSVVAERLDAISPLKVLARGYSVTEDVAGNTIRSIEGLQPGQELVTRLPDGRVKSTVSRSGPA